MLEKLIQITPCSGITLLLFLNCFLHILEPSVSEIKVKAVSPLYNIEVKNVSCYEATLPMFFHVQLPNTSYEWPDKSHISGMGCGGNKNKSEGYYCSLDTQFNTAFRHILRHLELKRTQFWEDNAFLQGTHTKSREKRQATVVIAGTSLVAGFLLRPAISKFTGKLFGSDEEWAEHFNALRDSLTKEHELLIDFQESSHNFSLEIEETLTNISEALLEQKWDLLWSLRLLNMKLHVDMISEAIQSCKTKHIPGNLIHHTLLKSKLVDLDQDLKRLNYTLAIEAEELAKYYKLPIADCLFTPTTAHISINIPLKRVNSNWKLHEIIHTKYAFNDQVCELYPQEAAFLAVSESNLPNSHNRSVLISNHMLKHCSVYEHQLCMIPQFSKDSVQSLRCVSGMFGNLAPEELLKSCSFRCYSNDELIVTQVSDTRVVVTNALNLTYNCDGEPEKRVKVEKIGALEINLSCDCSIVINDQELLPRPFPCVKRGSTLDKLLNVTVPALWTHNFTDLEFVGNHEDIRNYVNHNWPWLIPVLNFTKEKVTNFTVPEKVIVHSSGFGLEIWLGLLTLAFLMHFLLTFFCFYKIVLIRLGSYNMGRATPCEHESCCHSEHGKHGHHRHSHRSGEGKEEEKSSLQATVRNSFVNRLV